MDKDEEARLETINDYIRTKPQYRGMSLDRRDLGILEVDSPGIGRVELTSGEKHQVNVLLRQKMSRKGPYGGHDSDETVDYRSDDTDIDGQHEAAAAEVQAHADREAARAAREAREARAAREAAAREAARAAREAQAVQDVVHAYHVAEEGVPPPQEGIPPPGRKGQRESGKGQRESGKGQRESGKRRPKSKKKIKNKKKKQTRRRKSKQTNKRKPKQTKKYKRLR